MLGKHQALAVCEYGCLPLHGLNSAQHHWNTHLHSMSLESPYRPCRWIFFIAACQWAWLMPVSGGLLQLLLQESVEGLEAVRPSDGIASDDLAVSHLFLLSHGRWSS